MTNKQKNNIKTFDLYWAPEGRRIGTVQARTPQAAIRKAPKPYSKYKGEIYVVEMKSNEEGK